MPKTKLRGLAISAVMGAVGFVLMLLEFPVPLIPSFIKFDFSELPALIAAFTYGPLYGILTCLIKNLLHLAFSSSAGVGEISNFLLGAVFVGVAGFIYEKNKTRKSALIGCAAGAAAMAVISVATNYFVVYPAYTVIFGMPREAIIGAYRAILPSCDSLIKALLIFNLPFTFIKGALDSAICFLIYKKISPLLKYGRNKKDK